MSSKTAIEYFNGWEDGYAEACYNILDMLASIPESGELIKIKEAIRKSVEHDDR